MSDRKKPERVASPAGGLKDDGGKVRLELFPMQSFWAIGQVLTFGAKRYAPNNWKKVEPHRYAGALLRHLVARFNGEVRDPETGFFHLAHAGCNVVFLLWQEIMGKITPGALACDTEVDAGEQKLTTNNEADHGA